MKKPRVADYNQYMLGMDKSDKLMTYYSFLQKSVKWWQKILWLLEVVINSYNYVKKRPLRT